jgi:polyketide synthase PksN
MARPIEKDAPYANGLAVPMQHDSTLTQAGAANFDVAFIDDVTKREEAAGIPVTENALQIATVAFLKNLLSSTLKVPAKLIRAESPLEEYGIDSVMVIQLTQELESTLGSLSKTLFFEYQTLGAVAKHLVENHRETLRRVLVPAAQPAKKISESQPRTTSLGSSQSHASSHRSRRVSGFDVAPSRAPAKWQEIAIIGVAGRYPQANNLEEFWNNLRAGKDCISEIPSDRWDLNLYFDPEKGKLGKSYSKWGGFIDGVDHFDPLFFNISPREAEGMDPQERIFLQCAYHTLEDAGYTRDSLASYRASGLDGNVGVFVGVMYEEYQLLGAQAQAIGFPFALPGNPSSIANRVSYYLNLHGPSMALDTMCSSSLTAIHLACESLQRGGCELAIAGGVNVSIHPNKYLSLSQGRFFSSLGRCESFGEGGDGFVPGEGVGAVLLKPLAAAIADGDRIQGVIKATAINHGGKTNGYSVPNPVAQASVIAHALDQSGIPPRAVSYIEAHGTGTKLGDPIEITGLCKAFAQSSNDTQFCTIGSAKSNIGHCESAAGIAGVTKVLLQMKHRTFVPSLHAETLNPNIDFTSSPFVVQRQESEWLRPVVNIDGVMKEYSRIAGVSSFGAGGSNAHILIEEYVADGTGQLHVNSADVSSVIILSARTEAQLVLQVENLIEFIEKNGLNNGDLKDIAYTLQVGREAMEHRLAIVATTMQMLLEKLRLFIAGDNPIEDLFHGVLKRGTDTTEMFQADEDLRRALEAWIEKDKLDRLAEFWVKGLAFDWSRIHGVVKPRRIALPLYPFAQDRYWAIKPGVSLTSSSGVTVNGSAALHPLLQQNTSDFSEQRFVSVFNGQEFFLRDHQIGGTKVLPGVAYLEMARAAVQHSTSPSQWPARPTVNLRNIAWTHPFEVKDRLATLNIALHPEESGEITFEVFSDMERIEGDGAIKSISHAQGVIVLEEGEGAKSIDRALLRQCIEEPMDTKRFYDLHRSMGLHYGPAFQVVHSIAVGEDPEGRRFVLAELRLPQALVETRDQYGLHPSLLDGALHASLALFASEGSSGNDSVASASWLPFALDELSVLAPSPVDTWVVIRESSPLGSIVRKVDLQLCDETGGLWAEMKGFAARKLELSIQPLERQAVPVETSTAALEPMTFVEDWATALLPSPQKIELSTIVCFLSGNDGRYAAAEAISKQNAGTRIIFIAAGESYFKASPHDYRVPQNDPASMAKALREVEIEHGSLNAMLYLWPLETGNLSDAHRPIQILIQAVAIARLQCPRILLAAQWENELDRCYVDSWVGFTRSLRLITPATHWSVIGCDSPREGKTPLASNMDRWIPRLWNELQNLPGSGAFYLDEVRHTLTLHPAMLLDARSPLRNHGTYLITGGAGGLGSLVAEYLARKYAANLVLTGRSQLDADKSMRIEELEQFGATVIYHAANVSDLQEMSVALDNARRRFGSIDGIIHCAGLQQEENILDSNDESFRKVLEPKIEGSLVLDELLKDEPLEFIVYFSSSSAVLGDFGACGYAIANRFQNAFARYQNQQARHGAKSRKTVAIDWPLWRDGGMSVGDDQMTELYLRSTGQRALEIEEAMQLFEKLLADPRPVHLVMAGDPARIERLLGQAQGTSSASASRPVPRTNAIPTLHDPIVKKPQHLQTLLEPAIEFKMIDYLKTLLSSHLKLSFTLIAPDTPFEVFGIDSVIVMELTHELEKNLGSLSKTLFFEYSSIQTLASHLVRKYPGPVKEFLGVPRVPEADTVERNAQSITPPNGKSLKREHRSRFISDGKAPSQVVERANRDIAVIGLGGRYPKAENMDEFWANLKEGRDCVTEIPPDRWDHSLYFDPDRRVSGKSYSKWGGFIADVDSFDPLFFNINPFEARIMDPQERVFLETVWSLLENVGYTRQSMRERYAGKVGVYVGSMYHEYGSIGLRSAIANRVSYFFGFEGPSLVVDTMCSSSAVAVHNACVDLLNGDCRVAIAGGVNLSTHPIKYVSLSQAQLLGSHRDSRSFGQGDGYIPAEGVGAVLLKRLDHAIEDRDDIFAVIKATSINHGGRSNGYAIPNPNAQAQLIEDTLQKAGIDPRTISYVEAAANGSALGDPIELAALEKAFAIPEPSHAFCALGAVKSNLGHPEAASGMAQLSKVVLQMRHGQLVPSIMAEALNPNLKLEGSPFYLQRELTEWKRPIDTKSEAQQEHPRRAVLNSFGAGGSNACIVLEEFVSTKTREENSQRPSTTRQWPELVVLSAKNEEELRAVVDRMLTYLKRDPSVDLANLAYALQTSREAMNCRFATIVSTCEQLTAALEAYLGGSISLSQMIVHDIRSRSPIATLIEGKAGEAMLDTLVAERQLEKLALMWAHGAQVSWSSLPREGEVRIIALPSYPFAKVKMPSLGAANAAKIPQDPMHLDGNADSRVADVVSSSDTALWVQKTASVAPRTDLEITIASVWEETLGINGIGVNDSFLDLGGNSIQGGKIIAKLQEVFDIELPFEVLLGPQPTIAGCAVSVVAELLREAAAGTGQMDDQAEEAFQR